MTSQCTDHVAPAPLRRFPGLRAILTELAARRALRRQRQHLARLDDCRLRDIGLSPEEARREAGRPFWDAPAYWR